MSNDEVQTEPVPVEPTPPAQPDNSNSVPQWVRTFIVIGMFLGFIAHVAYDAITKDYAEFNTSLLLIGFVGLALGYDVMGRR